MKKALVILLAMAVAFVVSYNFAVAQMGPGMMGGYGGGPMMEESEEGGYGYGPGYGYGWGMGPGMMGGYGGWGYGMGPGMMHGGWGGYGVTAWAPA